MKSMVKFFDLRVSGGRAYHYAQIHATTTRKAPPKMTDWSVFLGPTMDSGGPARPPRREGQRSVGPTREEQRAAASPVYSLCSPSPRSPFLFAGLENNIVQLNLTSMADKHPDPLFTNGKVDHVDARANWDSDGRVMNLAMYNHQPTGKVELYHQVGATRLTAPSTTSIGFDKRWRKSTSWR
jgi:hypothetical protein